MGGGGERGDTRIGGGVRKGTGRGGGGLKKGKRCQMGAALMQMQMT